MRCGTERPPTVTFRVGKPRSVYNAVTATLSGPGATPTEGAIDQ